MKKRNVALCLLITSMLVACGTGNKSSENNNSSTPLSSESKNEPSSSADSSSSSQTPSSSSVVSSSSYSNKVTITVTNGTGSGKYEIGQLVNIDCTVPEGFEFEAWKEGETVFSKTKAYSFIASRDITLTASFVEISTDFANITAMKAYLSSIDANVKAKSTSAKSKYHDNLVINEYRTNDEEFDINFYKDAKVFDGEQSDLSNLAGNKVKNTEIFAIKNNVFYNTNKYEPDSVTYPNSAIKKNIVSKVANENKEIETNDAKEEITNNIVDEVNEFLTTYFMGANDKFDQTNANNKKTVTLESHKLDGNFYITNALNFIIDEKAEVLDKVSFTQNHYVKATSLDDKGALKEDAIPQKDLTKEYSFTYGNQTNLPSTYDLDSYFISSFDVEASYYDKNAPRSFSKDFKFLPLDATISIYQFDIVKDSVLPKTSLEELKIADVLSSDEAVIKYENSNIKTLKAGKADLTFVTTQGARCTYNVEVKALAPNKIEISSEDTVVVGERIELSATVSPVTASNELNWSVDNESIGKIVKENNKVYLEGVAQGNVKVKATAKDDTTKSAEKLIAVTKGSQSSDDLASVLVGTWGRYNYDRNAFNMVLTFSADGTFTFVDTYRTNPATNFTGHGTYELTSAMDTEAPHYKEGNSYKYVTPREDCYEIIVPSYTLTGSNAGSYYVDFHFALKSDGSMLYLHSRGSTTNNFSAEKSSEFEFVKA